MFPVKLSFVFLSTFWFFAFGQPQIDLLHGPLFAGSTVFSVITSTTTITKPTPCFVPADVATLPVCRRRRGIEERPEIIGAKTSIIKPSFPKSMEISKMPSFVPHVRLLKRYQPEMIQSSMDNAHQAILPYLNPFGAQARNKLVTVGDCGGMVVNFAQFLSCLGLTVQETTTLTATFTATDTVTSGYTTMKVAGCTPLGFPYIHCPEDEENDSNISASSVAPTTTLPAAPTSLETSTPAISIENIDETNQVDTLLSSVSPTTGSLSESTEESVLKDVQSSSSTPSDYELEAEDVNEEALANSEPTTEGAESTFKKQNHDNEANERKHRERVSASNNYSPVGKRS